MFEKEVAAGVAKLDKNKPGWDAGINLERLDRRQSKAVQAEALAKAREPVAA